MEKKSEGTSYDLTTDYRKLPAKNRAGLIRTARNLLKQQDEDMEALARVSPPSLTDEYGTSDKARREGQNRRQSGCFC